MRSNTYITRIDTCAPCTYMYVPTVPIMHNTNQQLRWMVYTTHLYKFVEGGTAVRVCHSTNKCWTMLLLEPTWESYPWCVYTQTASSTSCRLYCFNINICLSVCCEVIYFSGTFCRIKWKFHWIKKLLEILKRLWQWESRLQIQHIV